MKRGDSRGENRGEERVSLNHTGGPSTPLCPFGEAHSTYSQTIPSNKEPIALSPVDIRFIEFCRKFEYGELEVEVLNGEPAKVRVAKRDIDFRKSDGEIVLPWEEDGN